MTTRYNQGNEGGRGDGCETEIEDADFMARLRDSTGRLSSDLRRPAIPDIRDVEFDGQVCLPQD